MKRILLAMLLAATASCASLGAKGEDCTTPEDCELGLTCIAALCSDTVVTCGAGTVEQNGVCKYTPLRCGTGTTENEAGQCVPEPAQ